MDEAEYLCDDIVIMDKGQIIAQDTPQALLNKHFKGAIIRLPIVNLNGQEVSEFGRIFAEHFADIDVQDVEKAIVDLMEKGISLDGLQVKSANLDD